MKFLICILCLCKLLSIVQADCDPNLPKNAQFRLKEKLMCGYDKSERPNSSQKNQTQVFLMIIPRYIEFDDSKDSIRLSTLIYMNWMDTNLQWSKSDYEDLEVIPLKAESIWIPDFQVLNTKLINGKLNTQGQSVMIVKYNGDVHYATPTLLAAHCTADWTNWPLDKHYCNFTITSEWHMGNELDLNSEKIEVRMHKYIHSHEWKLLDYGSFRENIYSGEQNDSEAEYELFLTVRFTIQRHSSVLAASYFTPSIALIVFSLGILFIEPTNSDRLTIISVMLVIQCLYLQFLAYKIPSNGDSTPKIVKFFVCSLFITGVLIFQTLIVGLMPSWTSKPVWQQNLFNKIGSNKILQIILLPDNDTKKPVDLSDAGNEEGSAPVSNEDVGHHWKTFADIVNRLTFIGILMTHLIIIIYCFTL